MGASYALLFNRRFGVLAARLSYNEKVAGSDPRGGYQPLATALQDIDVIIFTAIDGG